MKPAAHCSAAEAAGLLDGHSGRGVCARRRLSGIQTGRCRLIRMPAPYRYTMKTLFRLFFIKKHFFVDTALEKHMGKC